MPPHLASLEVRECKPELFQDCDLVFSGLDSDVAGDIGRFRGVYPVLPAVPGGSHWDADESWCRDQQRQHVSHLSGMLC